MPSSRSSRPSTRTAASPSTAQLLNLGERTSERLRAVGIPDEPTLRAVGATEAWRRLKAAFPRQVTAVALYALHGALTGTHWNDFPPEVKAQMLARVSDAGAPGRTGQHSRKQRVTRGPAGR
jgi:DNA transformation protein